MKIQQIGRKSSFFNKYCYKLYNPTRINGAGSVDLQSCSFVSHSLAAHPFPTTTVLMLFYNRDVKCVEEL